jgi:hypothetical protein
VKQSPRKNPTKPAKPRAKRSAADAGALAIPEAEPRGRRPYPTDLTSAESNAEFLRGMADLFNDRANEVERAAAKEKGTE